MDDLDQQLRAQIAARTGGWVAVSCGGTGTVRLSSTALCLSWRSSRWLPSSVHSAPTSGAAARNCSSPQSSSSAGSPQLRAYVPEHGRQDHVIFAKVDGLFRTESGVVQDGEESHEAGAAGLLGAHCLQEGLGLPVADYAALAARLG